MSEDFTKALREDGALDDVVGHKTLRDGSHVPLHRHEAIAFLERAAAAEAKRATDMPDEQAAIRALWDAQQRLKELGWREAQYCPKDGSSFDVIEPGSTGIFRAHYEGEWPTGSWWLEDDGDQWPSRPLLFRLDPEAEAARKAKLADAAAQFRTEVSTT